MMAVFKKESRGTLHYGKTPQVRHSTAAAHQPAATIPEREEKALLKTQPATARTEVGIASLFLLIHKIVRLVKLTVLFIMLLIILLAIAGANARNNPSYGASAIGTATANVVRNVFTSSCTPLSFGSITVKSSAGLVILTPHGQRSAFGLVSLGQATFQPSRCDISGSPNASYTVKVPSSVEFTVTPNEETPPPRTTPLTPKEKFELALKGKSGVPDSTLEVRGIKVYSENKRTTNNTGKTNKDGKDALLLGATLHVTMNTLPGVYQGIIPVTVNY